MIVLTPSEAVTVTGVLLSGPCAVVVDACTVKLPCMPESAAVELVAIDFVVLDNSDAALTSNDVALDVAFPISEPELVVATPPQAETSKRDVIDSIKPTLNRLSIMLAVLFRFPISRVFLAAAVRQAAAEPLGPFGTVFFRRGSDWLDTLHTDGRARRTGGLPGNFPVRSPGLLITEPIGSVSC